MMICDEQKTSIKSVSQLREAILLHSRYTVAKRWEDLTIREYAKNIWGVKSV